jgi:hypothetical protein
MLPEKTYQLLNSIHEPVQKGFYRSDTSYQLDINISK